MNAHRHLSSEEICEQISEGQPQDAMVGCEPCQAEARSVARLFGLLRRADAEAASTTEWDDLLLRSRIRDAVAREKPPSRSLLDRFSILRPALVSALVVGLALALWSPVSHQRDGSATLRPRTGGHLPAWTPLPDESEDEGLAVLAEWTPNEDELTIARCRAACLGGLSTDEEEDLLLVAALIPLTGATPL
jgi:hypothetical protein